MPLYSLSTVCTALMSIIPFHADLRALVYKLLYYIYIYDKNVRIACGVCRVCSVTFACIAKMRIVEPEERWI